MATGNDVEKERALLEEATGWLLKLENAPHCSTQLDQFNAWLCSEERRRAWKRVNSTWNMLGAAKLADDQLTSSPAPAAGNSSGTSVPSHHATSRRPLQAMITLAAVAMATIVWLSAPSLYVAMRADYQTAAAETRQIHLDDGTTIDLGGETAISVDMMNGRRNVALLSGEAFFDVARDESRPFIVDVEGIEVRVRGTAFDIQVTSSNTSIALLRGSIEASPTIEVAPPEMLKPGERLVVDHRTGAMTTSEISPDEIGAWRDGQVFLADVTVSAAVELIQRYHKAWISIPDRGLANRRVSGLFDLRDPDRALAALVHPFGGTVREITPLTRLITRM